MKLVGVCACTSGIAHTYMAKEKLVKAAQALGHEIHVETQGTIGVEDPLTPEEIAEADAVILAVDIKVEKGRFEGKPTKKASSIIAFGEGGEVKIIRE